MKPHPIRPLDDLTVQLAFISQRGSVFRAVGTYRRGDAFETRVCLFVQLVAVIGPFATLRACRHWQAMFNHSHLN